MIAKSSCGKNILQMLFGRILHARLDLALWIKAIEDTVAQESRAPDAGLSFNNKNVQSGFQSSQSGTESCHAAPDHDDVVPFDEPHAETPSWMRIFGEFHRILDAQLLIDVRPVDLHSAFRNLHVVCDDLVKLSLADPTRSLFFPVAEGSPFFLKASDRFVCLLPSEREIDCLFDGSKELGIVYRFW